MNETTMYLDEFEGNTEKPRCFDSDNLPRLHFDLLFLSFIHTSANIYNEFCVVELHIH